MKHQVGEERVYLVAYTFHHWGESGQDLKQGWNWEAGTDAEVMEGCYLLACFTGLFSLLSYIPGPPGMAPPPLITN